MQRTILSPATLPPAALDELKDWLAITTTAEDPPLERLLHASLDLCEGFTGQMPLETACEEILPASGNWQGLATSPVQAITAVEAIAPDGTRSPLAPERMAIDLDFAGGARVRVARSPALVRIAVRFIGGIAPDWATLPAALRHGIVRLAAELYRDRTSAGGPHTPPAAVTALWRPWCKTRLV
ncbi:hypothetical protein MB02_06435 [Croceicoccus estronivorus]|uniref:head-tail connector protein n=1 Tax=Croceicoccus estronivorus TaxID=1172626 RepID=UPI00082A4A69|nr:hypothetical protein [Croceicoccus estronivorus]OCC24247.1 hypothetical protein MB02_06435 [Croceicoccus estronivorus]